MSDKESLSKKRVSRRKFLHGAAIGGGAAIGISLLGAPADAKVPQTSVNYQSTPKGVARCDGCVNWQPPSSCKLVDGKISPSGWCSLYHRK